MLYLKENKMKREYRIILDKYYLIKQYIEEKFTGIQTISVLCNEESRIFFCERYTILYEFMIYTRYKGLEIVCSHNIFLQNEFIKMFDNVYLSSYDQVMTKCVILNKDYDNIINFIDIIYNKVINEF